MSFLGLDIGTSGCKAVAFDESGRPLATAYRAYALSHPAPGWSELDADVVCGHACDVMREVAAATSDDPVAAMCVSSQGEAFVPVDAQGRALGNAMVSSDARADALIAPFADSFGADRLYRITGHTGHPMFTIYKLLWLRDERQHVWRDAASFHCFEDLLHLRLGLRPAMGWPLAGRTMLFDVAKHEWSAPILEAVGLDASRLARPLRSGSVVGTVPAEVARDLGLGDDVVVAVGGHDQTVAATGVGITAPRTAMYATGTVECICALLESPRLIDELRDSNLCTYDSTLPDTYATVAFSLTGGNALSWFRDEFGGGPDAHCNGFAALLEGMPDEPTSLLSLPYLTPSGTPHFDTRTPGALIGLRLTTTRHEVLKGLMEGVALEMKLNLAILERSGIPVDRFVASGGGARSPVLNQLKADVTGRPVTVCEADEAGCLGAAILARAARSGTPASEFATEMVTLGRTFEPDAAKTDVYRERLGRYERMYEALAQLWQLSEEIVFVDEIPKTSVGKFDKKTLRSQYESFYGEE